MPLIDKNNIKHIKISKWPNPYGITEKCQKRHLAGVPIEIITLAMKRFDEDHKYAVVDKIERLQNLGLCFTWNETDEGWYFWDNIDKMNYDVFYEIYTPEKLEKILKYGR